MTAVLPNNAYYISLDGSRRVTQRTRAHVKPIATFPLYAEDVSCVQPRPDASNDAAVVARPRAFPIRVATDAPVDQETPPMEPAHAPEVPDEPVKIERVVNEAPTRPASSSPVPRRRDRIQLPASVSQPPLEPSDASRFAPPVSSAAPKRRRGRPRKKPAPEPVADRIIERAFNGDDDPAEDASRRSPPPLRPDASASDPSLQPRVSLRRLDSDVLRPETRPGEASVASGRRPDQPEVTRARTMTRSGRVSRPPLFFGLGGDDG